MGSDSTCDSGSDGKCDKETDEWLGHATQEVVVGDPHTLTLGGGADTLLFGVPVHQLVLLL